jgi:Flp pilus assembly protein TadB
MKPVSQTIRRAVGWLLSHAAAVFIGSVMIAVGLGMLATVVMLPVGVITLLLGVLVVIWGLFARDEGEPAAEQPMARATDVTVRGLQRGLERSGSAEGTASKKENANG